MLALMKTCLLVTFSQVFDFSLAFAFMFADKHYKCWVPARYYRGL